MSSPSKDTEAPTSSSEVVSSAGAADASADGAKPSRSPRPPAKRRLSGTANAVIEISDTESDDSDICAVTSYQASADEVKRIRGDDYSSSSSSSDYSSDSESPWEDDSVVLQDEPPLSKVLRAQLNPRANRMDDPKLNPVLKSQELIDKLTTNWKEHKDYSSEEISLTCDPFRLCLLHDLLENSEIINNMVDDMNTLDWSRKKMDLYEFHQTADLASLTWQRGIRGIYELLKTEIMSWMSSVTGLELTSVSASCSLYGPGDHLLPHDDRLGDRRVAFILYVAPWSAPARRARTANGDGEVEQVDVEARGWAEHMGGALELLARDARGAPAEVARRVLPRNNTLAFFQVGHTTFHQVAEVTSMELPRLSINGWFHGPAPPASPASPPASPAPEEPPPPVEPHTDVVLVPQWVEPTYMSPRNRVHIQQQMERSSEACLRAFLLPERRGELLAALRQPDVPWEAAGPADRRRYRRVSPAWAARRDAEGAGAGVEHPVRGLLRLAGSAAFCRLLADCSDLALARLARLELQRWAPGDYTLLPPREQYQAARLEAVLYLGVPPGPLCGGATVYVAPEDSSAEESALVTLPPHDNALNLVYCDAGAAGFTKYLSKLAARGDADVDRDFYVLTCTYSE